MLRVRVFGGLALESDGAALDPPASRRARELLGFLALHPGRHARAAVAARFWPDVLDASARASLRTTLHELRRALGPAGVCLVADRDAVALDAAWVDARQVEALLAAGRAEEALALRDGELLAGLEEDWVLAERDTYRERLAARLGALADAAEAGGDGAAAVRLTREQVALDPYSEERGRALVRRLAAEGDRAAALAAHERLRERLRTGLGIAPSAETLVGGERGGAVALGREAADVRAPPLLGVRVQRDLLTRQPDGRGAVAARLGRIGERAQPRGQALAVRVALGQHPVLLEAGQQLAVAQRERLLGPARREQRLDLARVDPFGVERDRVAVGNEAAARRPERAAELVERRAQAGPRARVEDVGPEPRGDRGARVAAGMQREEAEQLAGAAARRRVERGPVGLEGETPEHAHAEHRDATLTLR